MSKPKPFFPTLALIFAGIGVSPVQASTPDPLSVPLKHCAALTDAGSRLACYDALAGSAASNQAGGPPPAANSAAANSVAAGSSASAVGIVASTPAAAPGAAPGRADMEFGVHNGALEAKLVNPHREKQMLAVVSAISSRPRGELVVTLDNGQVWTQIEATRYPLKTGDHVEIDVGAMGSYVLWSPSNRRATKVTRIS